MDEVPPVLEGFRAGQTGVVVLGRVIMGDIAATLVDLVQRDFLTVEETTDQGDWLLTVMPGTATRSRVACSITRSGSSTGCARTAADLTCRRWPVVSGRS